jgi:hypothetical protein
MGIRDGGIRSEEGFESGGCVLVRDGRIRFEISEGGLKFSPPVRNF